MSLLYNHAYGDKRAALVNAKYDHCHHLDIITAENVMNSDRKISSECH